MRQRVSAGQVKSGCRIVSPGPNRSARHDTLDGRALQSSWVADGRNGLAPAQSSLGGLELIVATDVTNPLYGIDGATHVFGPQKGAAIADVDRLDAGLRRLAPMLGGAALGAAGGLRAAFVVLGAQRVSGAELVLELTAFDEQLAGADLCITAEGRVDRSSFSGKVVSAVLAACQRAHVPCVVLGGMVADDPATLYNAGATAVLAIGSGPRSLSDALRSTGDDLKRTIRAVCGLR